jgi:hypothetical protein
LNPAPPPKAVHNQPLTKKKISVYWHALVSVQVKVLSAITQLTEIKILSGISVTVIDLSVWW